MKNEIKENTKKNTYLETAAQKITQFTFILHRINFLSDTRITSNLL